MLSSVVDPYPHSFGRPGSGFVLGMRIHDTGTVQDTENYDTYYTDQKDKTMQTGIAVNKSKPW
jgi:hypothetical protein